MTADGDLANARASSSATSARSDARVTRIHGDFDDSDAALTPFAAPSATFARRPFAHTTDAAALAHLVTLEDASAATLCAEAATSPSDVAAADAASLAISAAGAKSARVEPSTLVSASAWFSFFLPPRPREASEEERSVDASVNTGVPLGGRNTCSDALHTCTDMAPARTLTTSACVAASHKGPHTTAAHSDAEARASRLANARVAVSSAAECGLAIKTRRQFETRITHV
mmetsp:Transcript_10519/g.44776  ORF Transcript_10519/g.44776 Transcript_10519/m.44776 type:complete len:230 (-) Transcript_10519:2129-2818(-)